MSTRGMAVARRLVRNGTIQQSLTTLLLAAGVTLFLNAAESESATVIVQDFFGSTNDLGNGRLTRHDAAGNSLPMQSQKGPTLIGLDGLRAQFPDTSAEVWRAPGGQHAATWFFASASTDPLEPVTPGDENNLIAAGGADAGTGGHAAALLPLVSPTGAVKVSADMIPEGGDLRDWIAIDFSSSIDPANLTSNFENLGQAWLLLKMNATGPGATTWELHTNGLAGTTLAGNTTLTGGYIPLELVYDPVAHLVSGSINGVSTPTIPYTATGISAVGLEALEHASFGIADCSTVQTTGGLTPHPPGDYNHNGVVDAADYTVWRATLGQVGPALPADGNTNGSIDANDYNLWQANFGSVGGSGAMSAVPEPASAIFFALGALGLCLFCRQRSWFVLVIAAAIAVTTTADVSRAGAIP